MKFDNDCNVIFMFKMKWDIGFHGISDILDECSIKKCGMLQYFTGSQTKNASISACTCFWVMV